MTKKIILCFLTISILAGSVNYAKEMKDRKTRTDSRSKKKNQEESVWARWFKRGEDNNKKHKSKTEHKSSQVKKSKTSKSKKNKKQEEGFWARLSSRFFRTEEEKKQDKKRKLKGQIEQLKNEQERLHFQERAKRKAAKDKVKQEREQLKSDQERIHAQEKAKRRAERKEKERIENLKREEKIKRINERHARYDSDLRAQKIAEKEMRVSQMGKCKSLRANDVAKNYTDGVYADLYKVPSWPFYMLYTEDENKDLFRVEVKYDYATTAYNSAGSSQDVTSLVFGEKSIQWQDLSMALRLDKKGIILSKKALDTKLDNDDAGDMRNVTWDLIKTHLADKELQFLGSTQELGVSFDYFRYLKGKDLAFGVQVPFGYKSHRLKVDSPIDSLMANQIQVKFEDADDPVNMNKLKQGLISAATYATSSNVLEHSMIPETLNYLLAPKGLSYLPKMSVTGIGDVATFLNYYITTKYLERFVLGARVSWPTAKDAVTHKVWAPQLGNGFTKISAYASLMFNKQSRFFNPYSFLQASFNLPGHKKTRVPQIINFDGKTKGNVVNPSSDVGINYYTKVADGSADGTEVNSYLQDLVSFGSRINYTQARAYTEYDTQIPAFADNVKSVRVQPGPEFEMRLGNMFEEFILRRAFFDIYYNFMAKLKDYIGGNLARDIWAVDVLKDNTYKLEHKIGGEFSYQFDAQTRFHIGADWVFAGRNVAKNLELRGNMDVAF